MVEGQGEAKPAGFVHPAGEEEEDQAAFCSSLKEGIEKTELLEVQSQPGLFCGLSFETPDRVPGSPAVPQRKGVLTP